MALVNIRRDVTDPFYRYKMERLQSKIEGKGNGIKTVIVNLTSVGNSLARAPSYLIKYFGFELGAQTNINPADDRWIINGAHEASKLQDYLDGFIIRFVLCKKCKNPETEIHVKNGKIVLDCKACGVLSNVDLRLKLSSFILKNQEKKGKKDKSAKRAERRARREAGLGDDQDGSLKGSNDSNSDPAEDVGDLEIDQGSDDELTRRINADAKEIEAEKEFKWSVDMSEEAVKARAMDLPSDLKRALVVNGHDEDDEDAALDTLGNWILSKGEEYGGVGKIEDVEIYLKAQELGIERKHKTMTVLGQSIFDDGIVKQIAARQSMLMKMLKDSDRHQKAFLGGLERFLGKDRPHLIPLVSPILMTLYDKDLISEDNLKVWGTKASKKYVDITTSRKVRKSAEQFIQWLENAESDESDNE